MSVDVAERPRAKENVPRLNVAIRRNVLHNMEYWRSKQKGRAPKKEAAARALLLLGLASGGTWKDAEAWKPLVPYSGPEGRPNRLIEITEAIKDRVAEWCQNQFEYANRVVTFVDGGEALIKLGLMSGKTYEEAETLEPSGSG